MAQLTTLAPDPRVLQAWRTGPRWFHVVVALVCDPEVVRRRRLVADTLGDLIQPSAPDQPHVTLWTPGFGTVPKLPALDDLDLRVGGPDTFRSAAYLQVTGTSITSARRQLAATNAAEQRTGAFTPHLTVGTYVREIPMAEVRQRLQDLPAQPAIAVRGLVRHMVVDTRSPVGALIPADGATVDHPGSPRS